MSALIAKLAERYGAAPADIETALRGAMPSPITDPEFLTCCALAFEQGLNPLMREVSFERDPDGSIQPIVRIDGWIKRCNEHAQYDGMDCEDVFRDGLLFASKTTIHRKDRTHPTAITEYLSECRRDTVSWQRMPARNLRWRSIAQAARVTFGFAGMDPDEFAQWQERARSAGGKAAIPVWPAGSSPRVAIPEVPDLPDEVVEPTTKTTEASQVATDAQFLAMLKDALGIAQMQGTIEACWDAMREEISERGLEQEAADVLQSISQEQAAEPESEKTPAQPVASPPARSEPDPAALRLLAKYEKALAMQGSLTRVREIRTGWAEDITKLDKPTQALFDAAYAQAMVRVKAPQAQIGA